MFSAKRTAAAVLGLAAVATAVLDLASPAMGRTVHRGDPAAAERRAPAGVRLLECSRGPDDADRRALFRGAMRQVPGTREMWMHFRLRERVIGRGVRTVRAEGLGVWRKSRPDVRRFIHRQRVLALADGAIYRMVVSYRWYGADGKPIERARRRSRICPQRGSLPNLRVARILGGSPVPRAPGTAGYVVRVVNRGAVPASGFDVSLEIDGEDVGTRAVDRLGPREWASALFTGPVCNATVTARADPDDAVREMRRRDNALTSSCP
ncbi:MAG: CARDB domain-containing protein [Thermoleophilaceae bacterium]